MLKFGGLHLSELLGGLIAFASCCFPCLVKARINEINTKVSLYQVKVSVSAL